MYLDNNNIKRRARPLLGWKKNRNIRMSWFLESRLEFNSYVTTNDNLFFPCFIKEIQYYYDIPVVYTKFDLTQTHKQVRYNKYFKLITSDKRQLIQEYEI